MEIKIVKRPIQDRYTKSEEIQYPNEFWCVKTSTYREDDGGIDLWFKEIKNVNPDVIYLYDIKFGPVRISNGRNQDDYIEDMVYMIRYAFKKTKMKEYQE